MKKKRIFFIVALFLIFINFCIIPNYSNAIGTIIDDMEGANTPARW